MIGLKSWQSQKRLRRNRKNMLVEYIETIDKKRVKVIMEDQSFFPLYRGDLRKFAIEQGIDLSDEKHSQILKELVEKRGKDRAMYILKNSDKTEKQLRDKLAIGKYPPNIIDNIIEFLKSYGYVDDYAYAETYFRTYISSQSIKMIKYKLAGKGVEKAIIDAVAQECREEDNYNPQEMIEKILRKKHFLCDESDPKEKNRIISHLLRKGFNYDEIMETIRKSYKREQ